MARFVSNKKRFYTLHSGMNVHYVYTTNDGHTAKSLCGQTYELSTAQVKHPAMADCRFCQTAFKNLDAVDEIEDYSNN